MAYFILKNKSSKEETSILLRHQCYDKRLVHSTGIKVFPDKWEHDKQKIKGRNAQTNLLNSKLLFLKVAIDKILNDFARVEVNPSRDQLKEKLLVVLGKAKPVEEQPTIEFLDFLDIFIEERENNPKDFKPNTISKYKTFRKKIIDYAQKLKNKEIMFEQINHEFHNDFVAFMYNSEMNSKNSVSKYVKILKLVMKEAQTRGYHNLNFYRDFKATSEPSENIYLNSKDIDKLFKINLENLTRLERVRDLFILACETGLRFGDWSRVSKDDISVEDGIEIISMATSKTGERVEIPLSFIAKSILKKYDYELPKSISNQKTNEYLKELCQLAGFDDLVSLHRGGKDITEKRYKLISTHTARRSFATNAYLLGIKPISIMKITGHRSESSFMKYIKVTKRQTAIELGKHAFFAEKRNQNVKLKAI